MDRKKLQMLLGDLGILAVAFIWGATNVVIRDALGGITPFWFSGLRFTISFATVSLFFGTRALALPSRMRVAGVLVGCVFVSACILGALALVYTTAGNQSFIVSMSVVFVPLSVWFFTRKFPGWHIVASVMLCTAGMAGLMLDGEFVVNVGDALCFGSMLFITAYIILVQKYVRDVDPYGLACWQALGAMVLALGTAFAFEPFPERIPLAAWLAIGFAATIGFALTLVIQNVAQKYTTATHVAILLSTSSVFGSAIGVIFIGEPMTFRIFIASALILIGVLTAEAVPAVANSRKNGEKKN